jgi:hypothetical protein
MGANWRGIQPPLSGGGTRCSPAGGPERCKHNQLVCARDCDGCTGGISSRCGGGAGTSGECLPSIEIGRAATGTSCHVFGVPAKTEARAKAKTRTGEISGTWARARSAQTEEASSVGNSAELGPSRQVSPICSAFRLFPCARNYGQRDSSCCQCAKRHLGIEKTNWEPCSGSGGTSSGGCGRWRQRCVGKKGSTTLDWESRPAHEGMRWLSSNQARLGCSCYHVV